MVSCWSLSDPLEPWCRYIEWIEQTFPNGSSNLTNLLEKCIKAFKDKPECIKDKGQDPRYAAIWCKYANLSKNPAQVYAFMYAQQICDARSELYVNWAYEMEKAGDVKKATEVFNKGLENCLPEEQEALRQQRKRFQARAVSQLAKDMAEQEEGQGHEVEEERAVLGSLRGSRVGSVRVGAALKSHQPGVVKSTPLALSNKQKQKPAFTIFQDGQEPSTLPSTSTTASKSDLENLPGSHVQERENEQNAGKWTKAAVGKKSKAIGLSEIASKPSFEIHHDQVIGSDSKPKTEHVGDRVLAVKKANDGDDVKLFIEEPFDASKRPMYDKHLVYQGTTEFSFEELRAIKFRKKVREMQERQSVLKEEN